MQNKRSTKTNGILSLMMALIMTLGILPVMPITARAAGGTPDITWHNTTATSFTISTADQLAGLAQLVNGGTDFTGKTIKLTTDINLSDYINWTPIGTNNITPFTGTFDGDGYVINNLIINSTAAYVGLFGYIGSGGEVMNLGIASGTVSSTSSSTVNVGGLAGQNYGTITNCYNRSTVSGTGTGTGTITVKVGGLTGGNGGKDGTAQINNSYNSGTVSVTSSSTITVGGLTGGNGEFSSTTTAQINNSYNSGTVSVTGTSNSMISVGGVSGANVSTAQINNSYNSGTVSVKGTGGGNYIGGVSAVNNSNAQINNCYNSGMVSSTVSNSDVGGLTGLNISAQINNCYNSGNIMGTATNGFVHVGGLIGLYYSGTVSNCYYDKDKSPTITEAVGDGTDIPSTGLTTAQMTNTETSNTAFNVMMSALGNAFVKSNYSTTTNGCATSFYPELKVFAEDPASDFDKAMSKISVIASGSTTCTLGTDEQYFVDGNGSSSSPYLIYTPQQLSHVRQHLTTVEHFKMICDINLSAYGASYNSGNGWSPIGDSTNQFKGTFDGANHKITGLWIDRNTDNRIGLFGSINGARIQRLGVEADDSMGGVKGNNSTGVLAGYTEGNTVAIENCYAVGSVSGNNYVGGLVGYQWNGGSITNSYSTGSVFGTGISVGGLVGYQWSGSSITNSYSTSSVSGMSTSVGGLVGRQSGNIKNSYAAGSVSGTGRPACF